MWSIYVVNICGQYVWSICGVIATGGGHAVWSMCGQSVKRTASCLPLCMDNRCGQYIVAVINTYREGHFVWSVYVINL